jgi:hypothetical protein
VVALGLLEIARFQLLPKLFIALPFLPMRSVAIDQTAFALELLGVGALVGVAASWISVNRYLRA